MYYKKTDYKLLGYEKSFKKNKMYNALLQNHKTGKIVRVPFGSTLYKNFKDTTGLNNYPHLIHGDEERRKRFRKRMKGYLRSGYYNPAWFSYHILW